MSITRVHQCGVAELTSVGWSRKASGQRPGLPWKFLAHCSPCGIEFCTFPGKAPGEWLRMAGKLVRISLAVSCCIMRADHVTVYEFAGHR